MNFRTALSRAFGLRCPECGEADIADGWLSTKPSCSACGADLTVEAGYFLGAIYFNYGATILIVLSAAIPLVFVVELSTMPVIGVATVFCVAFPLWFCRYARSLWLAMDHYYHVRRGHSAELSTLSKSKTLVPPKDGSSVIGCICPLCHRCFHADASLSRKWGKCPDCYGDVLLLPVFELEAGGEASDQTEENATHCHFQLSK